MNFKFIFLILILFIALPIYAQEPTSVNYSIDDGLPSNEIYALLEDKDGFIWIGTEKGACRFNSSSFENFTRSNGLSDSDILSIHQDSRGRIWFLTYNGKLSYWKGGKIFSEIEDTSLINIRSESFFNSFLEDSNGNLWFGSNYDGIFRLDTNDQVEWINSPQARRDSKANEYTQLTIYESKNGKLTYSSPISRFELTKNQFQPTFKYEERRRKGKFYYHQRKNILISTTQNMIYYEVPEPYQRIWKISIPSVHFIHKVAYLSDEKLYVATDNGLYILNDNGKITNHFFKNIAVSDMLIDREGNLWTSTLTHGIFLTRDPDHLTFPTKAKYSILAWNDSIFFGGKENDLEYFFNNQLHRIPFSYSANKLISNQDQINVLKKGQSDGLWLGTEKALFFLKNNIAHLSLYSKINDITFLNNEMFVAEYFKVLQWNKKAILNSLAMNQTVANYSAANNLVQTLRNNHKFHNRRAICFSNKIDGKFLIATKEQILAFDTTKNIFNPMLKVQNVIAIQQTSKNDFWMLRKDSGLHFYNTHNQKLNRIRLEQEGSGIYYTSLALDENDNPAVGSNKGVFKIEKTKDGFKVKHFNQNTGLVTNHINDLKVVSGDIWLATSKGVGYLPKSGLLDTTPPILIIDSIINGNESQVLGSFSLSEENNTLSFYFTGISYKDLGELEFLYELKGKVNSKETIKERVLHLTDLPPSKYCLSLTAIDAQGNESKSQTIHFKVYQLWWKNWKYWFAILLLILFLGALTARILFKKSFMEMYQLLSNQFPFLEKAKFITVKSATTGGLEKINLNKLYYIEAAGDYMEFFTKNKKVLVRTTLKSLSEELSEEEQFMKVHKSYIVNLKKVDSFRADCLEILGKEIPIARNKKAQIKAYAALI